MERRIKNLLEAEVTAVSNRFIDEYMAKAGGEYVKVYLYLLRHGSSASVGAIADALGHTEADVRRALAYWQKAGVIQLEDEREQSSFDSDRAAVETSAAVTEPAAAPERTNTKKAPSPARTPVSGKALERLSGDNEFSQLIYIAQKYLNKAFTPVDCEVFAYLYGELHMPAELLEYLVEYCAQNNHTSIRYIEKVAISWHEKKLLTVEAARAYSRTFSKDSFAVMKAFGLTGRSPGEKEFEDIERWFKTYGFTKEIVTEACNRTMEAIHTPSFQYADQILREWKKAGVTCLRDIEELDRSRQARLEKAREQKTKAPAARKTSNRFHNLEEHDYDYDKMVWNMISPGSSGE